jgi:hypothetical protein
MEALSGTPSDRVHELLSAEHEPILSTTGTRAAVDSLAARTRSLETAVRELTEVVSAPGSVAIAATEIARHESGGIWVVLPRGPRVSRRSHKRSHFPRSV